MESTSSAKVTISVVSHGHALFLASLLKDIAGIPEIARVIVTMNIPEEPYALPESIRDRVLTLRNTAARGFGANHNAAFVHCQTPYYCVVNPDIRMERNPFPELLRHLEEGTDSLIAPLILNSEGRVEDSARRFPTLWNLLLRVTGIRDGQWPQAPSDHVVRPDWLAGMFMLFRSESYTRHRGFDERYFLYCEDTDICARLANAGEGIALCRQVSVNHDARRTSHREFRFAYWHLRSMIRFLLQQRMRGVSREPGRLAN